MNIIIENFGYAAGYIFGVIFVYLRYLLFAGLPFLIIYKWQKWQRGKIQKKAPKNQQIKSELAHSLITAFVFSATGVCIFLLNQRGYTQIYTDISEMGWSYLIFSIVAMLFLHDTYFYWMHRAVHIPAVFKYAHKVHHQSRNPNPLTAFSFDFGEAILEVMIVPIVVMIMPIHPLAIFVFFTISLAFNVMGHLGFEIMPAHWVKHPILKWINTPTHHDMHHQKANGNYGLYFNIWDRWMGTNHRNYESTFARIVEEREHHAEYSIS